MKTFFFVFFSFFEKEVVSRSRVYLDGTPVLKIWLYALAVNISECPMGRFNFTALQHNACLVVVTMNTAIVKGLSVVLS